MSSEEDMRSMETNGGRQGKQAPQVWPGSSLETRDFETELSLRLKSRVVSLRSVVPPSECPRPEEINADLGRGLLKCPGDSESAAGLRAGRGLKPQ